jgi:GxxExxY protein
VDHARLTEQIIGCAFTVHNDLGAGFLEKVYERALLLELSHAGLKAVAQAPAHVYYRNEIIGEYFIDILVNDLVIIEIKAVAHLASEHEVQLVNYLTATRLDVGLLINFGKSVTIKRKTRDLASVRNPVNSVNPV